MDPYRVLGVKRGCTRDEVKAAFRAGAWLAHPDRGGDTHAFVEYCTAYKQVLKEARVGPDPKNPPRAGHGPVIGQKLTPQAPASRADSSRKRRADEGPLNSTAPAFVPDLVLPENVGRDGQPAPDPDPLWQPELVLADETLRNGQPSQPQDAPWCPAVVFLEDDSDAASTRIHWQPESPTESFRSLYRRLSANSQEDGALSPLFRVIGILVFITIVAVNIWLCWLAFTYDPENAARQAVRGSSSR